jgi:predicted component of type VI protein secretion system
MLEKMIWEMERVVELGFNPIETRYTLAMIYANLGEYSKAESQLKEILQTNRKQKQARSALKELKRYKKQQ